MRLGRGGGATREPRAGNPQGRRRCDAIANETKIHADMEVLHDQAQKDIIKEVKQRGGEVTVNADTGKFTIQWSAGKKNRSVADTIALQNLRREAAEAGAYSLATIGRKHEIAGTPETIAKAEPLKGTFAEKVKEYIRLNQALKASVKRLNAVKKDAYNDLVDNYLAERVTGREPQSFKGIASVGTAVEVLTRRARSAVEPDLSVTTEEGVRDFPAEIVKAKE